MPSQNLVALYNDTVNEYIEIPDIHFRDVTELLEEFREVFAGMRGRCIDIGCGPGSITRKLLLPSLPTDAHIVGADISENMVKFAKETHGDEKRLSFIELNVEAEEIPDDQICAYDNAVSIYCLHWCKNFKKTFENIYQMLRPGGNAVVQFIAYSTMFDLNFKLSEVPEYAPYMKEAKEFLLHFKHSKNRQTTLKKLLEEAGFDVLHCSLREKTFVFENEEYFNKFFRGVNPYIKTMPENIGENYAKDFLREAKCDMSLLIDKSGKEKMMQRYDVFVAHFRKPAAGS